MARRRFQRGSLRLRKGKRGAVWVAQWREDEIQNGVRVRVPRHRVVGTQVDYPTKALAKRALGDLLAPINSKTYCPAVPIKLAEFAVKWEQTVVSMHKPSSQNSERVHLKGYIVPFFGELVLSEITPGLVQRFLSSLKLAPKTVRNIYATFRLLWQTARKWGLVQAKLEGIVLPRLEPVARPTFSAEQMQAIIQAAEEPFKTFFWLAAETGMRAGELCGLEWDAIDFRTRRIWVRRSVWRGRVGSPKTQAGTRVFTISETLAQHLERRRSVGLVFSTKTGQPWDSRFVVRDKLHPLLKGLGYQTCGLHAFRHGNATVLLSNGVDVKTVAARLGHADPSITLRVYAHAIQQRDVEAADKLGVILQHNATNFPGGVGQVVADKDVAVAV